MKRITILSAFMVVLFLGGVNAEKPYNAAEMKRFVEYLAGTALIANDKNTSQKVHAEKYRQLCRRTGVNAASAEAFIRGYAQGPEEWRKVQASVFELLDSIK